MILHRFLVHPLEMCAASRYGTGFLLVQTWINGEVCLNRIVWEVMGGQWPGGVGSVQQT